MFDFSRNQLIAASVIVAIALAGTVVSAYKSDGREPGEGIKLIEPDASRPENTEAAFQAQKQASPNICVHVAGHVKSPGIYEMEAGSRVTDAIEAAGGAREDADLDSINLAEKLSDAQRIYIACKGEAAPPSRSIVAGEQHGRIHKPASSKTESSKPKKLTDPSQGKVNLNTANLQDLQRLPGIGPATAECILQYRREHGRFQAIEELDEVRGIGTAKIEKLRPFLTL